MGADSGKETKPRVGEDAGAGVGLAEVGSAAEIVDVGAIVTAAVNCAKGFSVWTIATVGGVVDASSWAAPPQAAKTQYAERVTVQVKVPQFCMIDSRALLAQLGA